MRYEKFNECFSFALHYYRNGKDGSEMSVPLWAGPLRADVASGFFHCAELWMEGSSERLVFTV